MADIKSKVDQMRREERPYQSMVDEVAAEMQKSLKIDLDFEAYIDMARTLLDKLDLNMENDPKKDKKFNFETVNSPRKQEPELAPTWSDSWSSEEPATRLPSVSPRAFRSSQRMGAPARSPLAPNSRRSKSPAPARRGRSPARSLSRPKMRHPDRSPVDHTFQKQSCTPNRSKSPLGRSRSPFRKTECSPTVYYDCDDMPSFMRNTPTPTKHKARSRPNGQPSPRTGTFRFDMCDLPDSGNLASSFQGLSVGENGPSDNIHESLSDMSLGDNRDSTDDINHSFGSLSVDDVKFSMGASPTCKTQRSKRSSRKKKGPRTPVTVEDASKSPESEPDLFSPFVDTPTSTSPEFETSSSAASRSRPTVSTNMKDEDDFLSPKPGQTAQQDVQRSQESAKNVTMPFASPIPDSFQPPHEVLAATEPRGWRNVQPSPHPYPDAASPTFAAGDSSHTPQDPPASTNVETDTAEQDPQHVQFKVDLQTKEKKLTDRLLRKAKSKRGLRGKVGNPRKAMQGSSPLSSTNEQSHSAARDPTPSNLTPPQPMDCGTPKGMDDIQFNIGVGNKSTTSKPRRTKKRDTRPTPSAIPTQPNVRFDESIQFNIGVGSKSPKSKSRFGKGSPRPRRSQSAYFANETMMPQQPPSGDPVSSHSQDNYGRSFSVNESNFGSMKSMREAAVLALRDEGKTLYGLGDFRSSIVKFSAAISQYLRTCTEYPNKDLLAVLHSNRAACLMNLGAFQAAADECGQALSLSSDPADDGFSTEFGPGFTAKLCGRMARAFVKLGDADKAELYFNQAIERANNIMAYCEANRDSAQFEIDRVSLNKISTDATLGNLDISKLREHLKRILECTNSSCCSRSSEREKDLEALDHVQMALSLASGCDALHEKKVSLLANLKRWREIASHCERLAAGYTAFDGCFVDDLASKHPFLGVPPAESLSVDSFKGTKESDYHGASMKLGHKAAAEAMLRIPFPMTPYFARALRLQERYPAAEASLASLEAYINERAGVYDQANLKSKFAWLRLERLKLCRTREEREKGDSLFQQGAYCQAALQYAECITIDAEGISVVPSGPNAGGRLHAVLHCNRAACLMALKRYHEAVTECTAALRIHPRYMKAMLRRARCYGKLDRHEESIAEFKRFIEMAQQARRDPSSFSPTLSPCIFDGPNDASDNDIAQVKQELADAEKIKAAAEASARAEAAYRREKERRQKEAFRNTQQGEAQRRRDYFYSQQRDSRRWDSFADRGPKRSKSKPRSKKNFQSEQTGSGKSSRQDDNKSREQSTTSIANNGDHYSALGVKRNATESEIKKAYRRMALKYHPDKNKAPDAADVFRRVTEAYEVLMDASSRRKYDLGCRW
eukprot:scaffold1377_cov126-Cylindrotheca_fusiformis.AAC.26